MSVIDYRGYRVVALSLLPISNSSIIYGSPDAGATVYALDDDFNDRMEQATAKLNLKPHIVGAKQTLICGPGDIEGHKSQFDGKYYVIGKFPDPSPPPPVKPLTHFLFSRLRALISTTS